MRCVLSVASIGENRALYETRVIEDGLGRG